MAANGGDADKWKQKYFRALEDQEHKETEWHEVEANMRRGLSRLALAATGVDENLDRHLIKLRRAIQDGANSGQLDLAIEKISSRLKRLDEKASGNGKLKLAGPAEALLQLLKTIEFPRSVRSEVKALKRQLKEADQHVDVLIAEFAKLMHLSFSSLVEVAEKAGVKKGVWKRLFAADGDGAQESVSMHPAASDEAPRVLAQIFSGFLDELMFPAEFTEQVADLQRRLAPGLPLDDVEAMARTVVDLVMAVRISLEREKEELESFLKQLGIRIQELDHMVEGADQARRASVQSGIDLDEIVTAQVNDIEMTVQTAKDVEEMKGTIRLSLESIRSHLAKQREVEAERQDDLEIRFKQLTERMAVMEEESEQLRTRLAEERQSAMTDSLTGVPNRLAYDKQIASEYARWQRHGSPLSMLVCDIDFFKKINDNYGHKAGDRALVAIAQAISYHVRASDFLARVGGEEFVVLLPETDVEGARAAAEKIRSGVERLAFVHGGQRVPITLSGGVAEFAAGDTPDEVYSRADKSLYSAKQQGRNRFC